MIDPISITIGATAVSALSTGANIVQLARQRELERLLKRQRLELYAAETAIGVVAIATCCESFLWKRKYLSKQRIMSDRIANIENAICVLTDRINQMDIDVVKEGMKIQSSKIDEVLEKVSTTSETKDTDEKES